MTIEYQGAAVYGQRTIRETGPKGNSGWYRTSTSSRDKSTLHLIPATDPMEDKAVYTRGNGQHATERVIVGPQINEAPECKVRNIRWYDQTASKKPNRYPFFGI